MLRDLASTTNPISISSNPLTGAAIIAARHGLALNPGFWVLCPTGFDALETGRHRLGH